MGVMSRNPNKPANELLQQINGWPLLPRKIFPASLTPVKDALSHTLAATSATASSTTVSSANGAAAAAILSSAAAGDLAAAQAAASAAPVAITAAPPGLSKELEKALDDIEAAAAGRAGPAVQEPPTTTKPKTGPIKPKEKLHKMPKGMGGSVLRPPAEKQQQREQQQSRREKELADRKAYLKNFWYAAGKIRWCRDGVVVCVRGALCLGVAAANGG
jgi:hypothetical protein